MVVLCFFPVDIFSLRKCKDAKCCIAFNILSSFFICLHVVGTENLFIIAALVTSKRVQLHFKLQKLVPGKLGPHHGLIRLFRSYVEFSYLSCFFLFSFLFSLFFTFLLCFLAGYKCYIIIILCFNSEHLYWRPEGSFRVHSKSVLLTYEIFARPFLYKPPWPSGLVRWIRDPLSERTRVRIPVYPILQFGTGVSGVTL